MSSHRFIDRSIKDMLYRPLFGYFLFSDSLQKPSCNYHLQQKINLLSHCMESDSLDQEENLSFQSLMGEYSLLFEDRLGPSALQCWRLI